MQKQPQAAESDLTQWRQQMDERMRRSLRNQIFEMSITGKLYRYLQTQEAITLFGTDLRNTFEFAPADFKKVFSLKVAHGQNFKKEGFNLTWNDEIFLVSSSGDFNSQCTLQQAKTIWLQNVISNYQADTNKFIYKIHKEKFQDLKWIEQKNVWHYPRFKNLLKTSWDRYGFSKQSNQQFSHPYLHPQSSTEAWLWVNQFFKLKGYVRNFLKRGKFYTQNPEKQQMMKCFLLKMHQFLEPDQYGSRQAESINNKLKIKQKANKKLQPTNKDHQEKPTLQNNHEIKRQSSIKSKEDFEKQQQILKREKILKRDLKFGIFENSFMNHLRLLIKHRKGWKVLKKSELAEEEQERERNRQKEEARKMREKKLLQKKKQQGEMMEDQDQDRDKDQNQNKDKSQNQDKGKDKDIDESQKTQKAQNKQAKKIASTFKIYPRAFQKFFHQRFRRNNPHGLYQKQGFTFTDKKNKKFKKIIVTVTHDTFNQNSTKQQTRAIWLEAIKKHFLEDRKSMIANLYHSLHQNHAQWDDKTNTIIVHDKNMIYRIRKIKQFSYGFSFQNNITTIQYTHPYLNRNTPIQVWIWIRQFIQNARSESYFKSKAALSTQQPEQLNKSSSEDEKRLWALKKIDEFFIKKAQKEQEKKASYQNSKKDEKINKDDQKRRIEDLHVQKKFMSMQDNIPIPEGKNPKDTDTKIMKQQPFSTLSTRKKAMTKIKAPQRSQLRQQLEQSDGNKRNKRKTKIFEPQQEQQEAPKKRRRKDSMQKMTMAQYLALNPQYPKQSRPPTE